MTSAQSPLPASPSPLLERSAWLLLCVFVFTMPWEKSVLIPGVGSIARLAGLAAFVLGVLAVAQRRALRPPNLVLVLAALFVAWSAATWGWSLDRAATVAKVFTLAQVWGVLWLLWEFCRSAQRHRWLLAAYLAGAVAGSSIAIVRYAMHMQTSYRRYAATGFDPNDFGLMLVLALPMALYLSLEFRGHSRWLCYAAGAIVIAAILLTASRTALVASFASFAFVAWTWRRADLRHRAASVALLAFLLLSLFQFAPAPSRSRLATLPEEIARGSINSRKQIWKSGARVWLEHPWLGVGAGAYPEAVRPQLGTPSVPGARYVAHNTFLSVLVEGGIVGLAVWGALFLCLAVFAWMLPAEERAFSAVLLGVWLVAVSMVTWEHYKGTWLVFGLIMVAWQRAWLPSRPARGGHS
ncbi:MAG: O-antigen ligase family protein [Bryobacterales bacterium]|nr:O-antigen ligase family protein [Bryobacterales bacterium]